MKKVIIYWDESSVNNKDLKYMWVGTIFCDKEYRDIAKKEISKIKEKYNFKTEIKRRKVNYTKLDFYKEIIDYFIESNLNFYWIKVNKDDIDLQRYHKDDLDIALYKRYYFLLRNRLENDTEYYIYLDKRTTKEKCKISELRKFLEIEKQTPSKNYNIKNMSEYESSEHILIQITDFLIGAVCYAFNNTWREGAKNDLITYISQKLKKPLTNCSFPDEKKFNIFCINLWAKK